MTIISEVPLDKNYSKPVFEIMGKNDNPVLCMLDTGADMSVWCAGIDNLNTFFPDVKGVNAHFMLGGFGKGLESVKVYSIPDLDFFNITFHTFHVAVDKERRFSYDLILSGSVFSKMDYSILHRNVDTPILQVVGDHKIYSTGLEFSNRFENTVAKLYSFYN